MPSLATSWEITNNGEDLHLQAPPQREVPQRPDDDRRRREVQHRARPRPEDGVAVALLAERDQGDQGRRPPDRADEPRRALSPPRLVRRDPGVGDHPQGTGRAGEPQDQGHRHGPVQTRRVRAAGSARLRAEPRLLGQVAPVSRRHGLQGPDGGERPDRRPPRGPDPVRVPQSPGRLSARGRPRDHHPAEPVRLGRPPLHQRAQQAAQRRAGAPGDADGRRHERGDPEGRVRGRGALGPRAHGLRRLVPRPEDPALPEGRTSRAPRSSWRRRATRTASRSRSSARPSTPSSSPRRS